MARLLGYEGPYELAIEHPNVVGRNDGCDIALPGRQLSKFQATVYYDDGVNPGQAPSWPGWYILNHGKNPTLIETAAGDGRIRLEDVRNSVVFCCYRAQAESRSGSILQMQEGSSSFGAVQEAELEQYSPERDLDHLLEMLGDARQRSLLRSYAKHLSHENILILPRNELREHELLFVNPY